MPRICGRPETAGEKSLSYCLLRYVVMMACMAGGCCNYLFISMSPQLYIPGQHYSLLTFYYNIGPIENKEFDISVTLQLNQVSRG